jgi:hypothetical protein
VVAPKFLGIFCKLLQEIKPPQFALKALTVKGNFDIMMAIQSAI